MIIKHQNEIKLIDYFGSDETHLKSLYLHDNIEDRNPAKNSYLEDLKKAYNKENLSPFNNSLFTFIAQTDILTYNIILHSKIGKINDKGKKLTKEESYYIPYDFNNIKLQQDIGDFAKKGECYFDVLKRYTEIGDMLENDLRHMNNFYYSISRGKTVSKLFRSFNKHIEYSITLTFKEFVEFFREYTKYGYTVEVQEMVYYMLDTIKGLEGKPFNKSLIASELIKE